jgi:hypothetical protein
VLRKCSQKMQTKLLTCSGVLVAKRETCSFTQLCKDIITCQREREPGGLETICCMQGERKKWADVMNDDSVIDWSGTGKNAEHTTHPSKATLMY